jgi:hypothetical protein
MRLVAVRDDQSMTGTSRHAKYSVQMLISDWLIIDGTMDNHAQSSIDGAVPDDMDEEDGRFSESPGWDAGEEMSRLPRTARLAMSIRRAGWDQIPGWPHDVEGFKTWPAPGQMAMVTLTGAQWKLVVFALRCWADVHERLSDAQGAAKSRAIADAVGQRLVEQGWSPGRS